MAIDAIAQARMQSWQVRPERQNVDHKRYSAQELKRSSTCFIWAHFPAANFYFSVQNAGGDAAATMPWDMRYSSREDALATLNGKPPGTFVLRSSKETFAALSLVKPDGSQHHMHIEQSAAGVYLRKCKQAGLGLLSYLFHVQPSPISPLLNSVFLSCLSHATSQTFPDLFALVQHYASASQTDLPVPLLL